MALSKCNVRTNSKQKETTPYGSIAFPIAIYEDNMETDSVPVHWHKEFEFIIATKGIVTVLLDGTRLELTPGEAVFINSGCLHGGQLLLIKIRSFAISEW